MKKTNYQPFWFSEALAQEDDPVATPLQDNISTDVCIIGGGYTGLWTALQLKIQKPELDIVIMDKGLCGSGASGRNGGCMLTWSTKYFSLKRLYGVEEACRLVKASEEAPFHIRDFCLKYGIDAQIRLDGTLYTATNEAQLDSIEPGIKALKEKNINSWEHWSAEQVQSAAGSRHHIDGHYSPAVGSLQPGLLVRGLKRVAQTLGIHIYENTSRKVSVKGSLLLLTLKQVISLQKSSHCYQCLDAK